MARHKRDNSLAFHIGKLWSGGEGTTFKFDIDVPAEFDDPEIVPVSNLIADIMLIKLKDEISVIVSDAEITVKKKCEKCLAEFKQKVNIPEASREFIGGKLRPEDDPNEIFKINFDDMTIDLTEMFRQEISLHFPLISVCSKSCKGICPVCKKNRNRVICGCKMPDESNRPFKDLKKLLSKKT